MKYYKLLLPPNTRVKDISVSTVAKTVKTVTNKIFPGQLPEPTSINFGKQKFIPPDNNIYNSTNPFPANTVQVIRYDSFDGDNTIVTIALFPVQYFPVSNSVEFNTNISFNLNLENYSCN